MKLKMFLCGWLVLIGIPTVWAGDETHGGLRDTTVLIIRHAEKPTSGWVLAPAGVARAQAYPEYFKHLVLDGQPVKIETLFAAANSKGSHRPWLTIEPTSRALGLPIDARFADKNFAALAQELKAHPHGRTILIAWHHGEIPSLLQSLGANPAALLPGGKWPAEVFGWMMVLHYDAAGHLIKAQRINEHLMPDDDIQPAGKHAAE